MFIPKAVWEKITSVYDGARQQEAAVTERALQMVLAAKDHELAAILESKNRQIDFLTAQLELAQKHNERERAAREAAIDALLAVKVGVAGVRHADLQRAAAEGQVGAVPGAHPAASVPAAEREDVLRRVFRELHSVGEDEPGGEEPGPLKKDEALTVNGMAVMAGGE